MAIAEVYEITGKLCIKKQQTEKVKFYNRFMDVLKMIYSLICDNSTENYM